MAKSWNVQVTGTGVALPDPATLHGDLTHRTKGAMRVLENTRHNFAVGASNLYSIETDDSANEETIEAQIRQSARVYVPEKATLTVKVTPAQT